MIRFPAKDLTSFTNPSATPEQTPPGQSTLSTFGDIIPFDDTAEMAASSGDDASTAIESIFSGATACSRRSGRSCLYVEFKNSRAIEKMKKNAVDLENFQGTRLGGVEKSIRLILDNDGSSPFIGFFRPVPVDQTYQVVTSSLQWHSSWRLSPRKKGCRRR